MKTETTFPGKTYAVSSANGCIVTTADGITLVDVAAGKQGYFVAVGGKVQLSDDSAILTQVFKLAPQQRLTLLGVLGGGTGGEGLLKYAECVTRDDMLAVNPDYKNDFTSDGEWIYPLTCMTECSDRYGNPAWYLFEGVKQKLFVTTMPAATSVYRMFYNSTFDEVRVTLPNFSNQTKGVIFGNANIKKAVLIAPNWEDMGWLCSGGSIESLEIDAPVTRLDSMAPKKDIYVLKHVKLTTTQLSTADGAFTNAQLTRESTLHILNILPFYYSGTHKLTIGMHADLENDEEVRTALDEAFERGWTIIPQWNGTPTASTFSLRPAPPRPVYAKVAELERPDGTTERVLDWGHDVLNPDGKEPEELGYTLFDSVEAAREYYGLPEESFS